MKVRTLMLNRQRDVHGERGGLEHVLVEALPGTSSGWVAKISLGQTTAGGTPLVYRYLQFVDVEDEHPGRGDARSASAVVGTKTFALEGDGVYLAESVWKPGQPMHVAFIVERGGLAMFSVDGRPIWGTEAEARKHFALRAGRDLEAEREAVLAVVRATVASAALSFPGLRELVGSPRQIEWALDVRARALFALQRDEPPEVFAPILEVAKGIVKATWWIDRRAFVREELAEKARERGREGQRLSEAS